MLNPKQQILGILSKHPAIKELEKLLTSGKETISIKHLAGSMKAFLVAALWLKNPTNLFIFCHNKAKVETWLNDLSIFVKPEFLAPFLENKQKIKLEDTSLDESSVWMIEGLNTIQKKDFSIGLSTPEIFQKEFPKPETISKYRINLKKNETRNRDELCKTLLLNGFERKDFVSVHGDLAVRGAIVDIFPIGWDNPLRLEFWGDEIDSMREFNPLSQRSSREHTEVEFIGNVFHSEEDRSAGSILDFINKDTIFIIDEPEVIESEHFDIQIPEGYQKILINSLIEADISVKSSPQPAFQSSVRKFCDELRNLANYRTNLIISADSKIHQKRIQEILENTLELSDDEAVNQLLAGKDETLKLISWLEPSPSEGFVESTLSCFTEHQIFDRLRVQENTRGKKYSGGLSLKELKQLHAGDYVVHVDKGIGRFEGFERVTFGGSEQDCVRLTFAEGDKLYVHLNYIHKIQKYSAQEGVVPKLSKLGSADWLRKKEKTKKKLKDIARELITIYAQRKMKPGFAFATDTMWQKEFEASFMYEDTPDQSRSTSEVKKDMESETPMDRLVCGDVGFGKTEVAIRAAFKAVQSGKQVAVLVPTTILAQQHYMTFSDRLNNYPVMIDSISRFRTTAEQKVIVQNAKEGKIDILIGTHRILSKDIVFKDLGLLVIDEEHRFGVGAKEKLRELRTTIDTMTLTATPIPRTLNFSLMGARDLSVMETPPRNRIPTITEIMEWDDDTIVKAIEFEIGRGGQVFFVTDKIEDINIITGKLQMLMPKFRFAIAHGQMKTSELESVMERFIKGKFDVMVTTKIIESGLDIPNANTMIINRSNKFGLAELYQLRGRVGRSKTQAYCYLLIPPAKMLSTISLRRLQAIEEFTDLGSGFQLAMRDMEIRGAGNLLGPEQSGFIIDIGFELFHKILDEAVAELRTEEFGELFKDKAEYKKIFLDNSDIAIIMNTDALLPKDFIESDTERFAYYKKLYNVKSVQDLQQLADELKDRFGKLPHQAKELIFAVKLRLAALNTGLSKISLLSNKLIAEFPPENNEDFYQKAFPLIAEFIPELEGAKLSELKGRLTLEVEIENRDKAVEVLWRIKKILETIE